MSEIQRYPGYDGIDKTIVFEIDTINKCNFTCSYCEMQNNEWNPDNPAIDWGKTQDIVKLIPFFKDFPYEHRIHLLGGEPTLHRDIVKFIEALQLSDLKLFTNGTNIKRLKAIANIKNPPAITVSIHLEEFRIEDIHNLIEAKIHSVPNFKCLIILSKLKENIKDIRLMLTLLKEQSIAYDMYMPFDQNGEYRIDEEDKVLYYELFMDFPLTFDHLKVYESRNNISQVKTCYKNLWLVNYKGQVHKDGTLEAFDLSTWKEQNEYDYSYFKFQTTECSKTCFCPANNYYTKIRY